MLWGGGAYRGKEVFKREGILCDLDLGFCGGGGGGLGVWAQIMWEHLGTYCGGSQIRKLLSGARFTRFFMSTSKS